MSNRNNGKKIWLMISSLIAGMTSITSCSQKNEQSEAQPISVKTEQVTIDNGICRRRYVGVVEAAESSVMSFQLNGIVQQMYVAEGDRVAQGKVLATLDRTSTSSALNAAEAMLKQAKDAHARLTQLHDNASLPEIKMVEVQTKLQQAQAAYDIAEKSYRDGVLTAPFSGVIGKKYLSAGENVVQGQPVYSLLGIGHVKVKFSVPEMEISDIRSVATKAEISVAALAGEVFHSEMLEKGVQANPLTHTYNVYANVANTQQKLLPGMVCQVYLSNEKCDTGAATVPLKSVHGDNNNRFVWTVNDGKAHRTKVVVGETTGNFIVIREGLKVGERIITDGYQKVSEGTRVSF